MDIKTEHEISKEVQSAPAVKKHKAWIVSYGICAVAFLAAFFLLRFEGFGLPQRYHSLLQRLAMAGFVVFIVLIATRGIELLVARRSHTRAIRYNVVRLVRLLSMVVAALIVITFLFENWYTAAVSLGLFSLILGFALQTPISSLIGWFYIIFRAPYRIGDRIQVGTFTGDVVEISYLDTTLWEFHGDYLSNDLPSGRLIRFPNSLVFQSQVYNYSWKKFPFIWNELPFHIAYTSDLEYVERTIKEVTKQELGPNVEEQVKNFRALVGETPVDELDIKEYPYVVFRTNPNTWIEVSVTYLVAPKKASAMRTRLIKQIVGALLREPERVQFPKGDAR